MKRYVFIKDYFVDDLSEEELKSKKISSVNLGEIKHVNNNYGVSICIVQNSSQLDEFNAFNDSSIHTRYFVFTYKPNEDDIQNANWFGHGYCVVQPKNFLRTVVEVFDVSWNQFSIYNNEKIVINVSRDDILKKQKKVVLSEPKEEILNIEIQEDEENVVDDSEE